MKAQQVIVPFQLIPIFWKVLESTMQQQLVDHFEENRFSLTPSMDTGSAEPPPLPSLSWLMTSWLLLKIGTRTI